MYVRVNETERERVCVCGEGVAHLSVSGEIYANAEGEIPLSCLCNLAPSKNTLKINLM